MKSMVVVFDRQLYTSNSDGTAKSVACPDRLRSVLGQAKSIRLQWVGFRMTANCEVKFKMWESGYNGMRPSELAATGSPFFTSAAITALRPASENITGPFGGNVEFTMEVRNNAAGSLVEADGLMACTLILEE
jgi:hypothetical protein